MGFYSCDAEFAALIVPFAEAGVAAGQPVILGYDDRKTSLLRSWLSDPGAVTFVADASLYVTPARAIASYWQLFAELTASGATQIRIALGALDVAARTPPRIVLPLGQYLPRRRYQDLADFQPLPPEPDPLEDSAPPSSWPTRHRLSSGTPSPASAAAWSPARPYKR